MDILLYGNGGEKLKMPPGNRHYGTGHYSTDFEGIVNNLERRFRETSSDWMREEIDGWMSSIECPECHGARLKKESAGCDSRRHQHQPVLLRCRWGTTLEFINQLKLTEREQLIAGQILKEIRARLGFLRECGPGLSDPVPVRRPPCRAARASASVWRPRSAPP